jgi:FlaA1/EpsC-like NDP-sugar epimerase
MRNIEILKGLLPGSKRKRMAMLMTMDILIACVSGYLALLARFDFSPSKIDPQYLTHWRELLPVFIAIVLIEYVCGQMYAIMWSQAGIREAIRIMLLNLLGALLMLEIYTLLQVSMPRSFFPLAVIAQTILEFIVRFSYRMTRSILGDAAAKNDSGPRTMIVGAGQAGGELGKELVYSTHTHGHLVCYIDADPAKKHLYLNGAPILGNRRDIIRVCQEEAIEQIFVALPMASSKDRTEILEICRKTNCKVKTLPGIYQLINGEVSVSKLRNVEIEDLLGRDSIKVNLDEIAEYVKGKTVLITGGGGSIGSELCRQIANHQPKLLIVFDIYENNAYDIQQELKETHPDLNMIALIGSVRNTNRMNQIMKDYRPDIVYHAAAHKHVPLMEDSPNEAIKNNVFGTYKTAQAAGKYGVKRFVMISTDKAVNPTNIMGASKRMCEMIIQMMDKTYPDTDFVAVRFGNVLGSNGSVIPLFKKQIAAGGPVTVTDKNIIRYFMTIPEAVSLVLQAGYYAKGGEIFVLDMGQPVKILDLAENLIRLSGLKPYEDIPIVFTGLRPGEKLYEEMLMKEEGMKDTPNHMIHIGKPLDIDYEMYRKQLDRLYPVAIRENNGDQVKRMVAEIVPTYHPQFQKNQYLKTDREKQENVHIVSQPEFSMHQAFAACSRKAL